MKDNSGYLDANVVIRLLTNDIPDHKDMALNLIETSRTLKINDIAIIETIYALAEYYKVPRSKIAKAISNLSTHKKIEFNSDMFELVLHLYSKQPGLSIEDCYLAVQANIDKKMPLWTFDKKLAKQSGGLAKEVPAI